MCFRLEYTLHWPNRGHVDEFKSNVSLLVNISKIVDQPANIAVALSGKIRVCNFDYFHS